MEGLTGLVAAPTSVEIDGKAYTLTPIPVREFAKVERRILERRGDPISVAKQLAEGCTPEERREIFERAYQDAFRGNMVSAREIEEYKASLAGMRFLFWLSLRKEHPEINEDDGSALADQFFAERLEAIGRMDWARQFVDFISGMPEGNLSSPAMEPGTESTQNNPSPGSDGSEPSPKPETGATPPSET